MPTTWTTATHTHNVVRNHDGRVLWSYPDPAAAAAQLAKLRPEFATVVTSPRTVR